MSVVQYEQVYGEKLNMLLKESVCDTDYSGIVFPMLITKFSRNDF